MFESAVSHLNQANEKSSRDRHSSGREPDSSAPSPMASAVSDRSKDSRSDVDRDDRHSSKRKHDGSGDARAAETSEVLLSASLSHFPY